MTSKWAHLRYELSELSIDWLSRWVYWSSFSRVLATPTRQCAGTTQQHPQQQQHCHNIDLYRPRWPARSRFFCPASHNCVLRVRRVSQNSQSNICLDRRTVKLGTVQHRTWSLPNSNSIDQIFIVLRSFFLPYLRKLKVISCYEIARATTNCRPYF